MRPERKTMSGLMFPKQKTKKKRKKHAKSILKDKEDKRCYLCMLLYDDHSIKRVHEHHICFGTANRAKSEELGLKVNVCIDRHHKYGPEAVHNNKKMSEILKAAAQRAYEQNHTHEEWVSHIGKNYLD